MLMKPTKLPVVCLCGQVKYRKFFFIVAGAEELKGKVVLMPTYYSPPGVKPSDDMKKNFVAVHNQKIDMADELLIINPEGTFGDDTAAEIARAVSQGKPIRYLVDV